MSMIATFAPHRGRLASLPLIALVLAGCDPGLVTITAPFSRSFDFSIDTQFGVADTAIATSAAIRGALQIPPSAEIKHVDIESVRLFLQQGPGNATTTAVLGLFYDGNPADNDPPQLLSTQFDVPIVAVYSKPVDNLVANVVSRVRTDLERLLKQEPGAPASVSVLVIAGSRQPTISRLVVTGRLSVRASVTYEVCRDVSAMGVGPRRECSIGLPPP